MSTGSTVVPGGGDRTLLRQSRYITTVALEEAARLGHPEVDVEHLLLGLSATGGPSAGLLTAAGAGLAELRGAVADLQRQDLAALGVDAPAAPAPEAAPSFRAAQSLPYNDRAMALMRQVGYGGDDRALLVGLLDDDGRRVPRLLQHLGVDVAALRAGATAPRNHQERRAAGASPAPEGTGGRRVALLSQDVPVEASRVWALVSDPHRRPEWDTSCVGVDVDTDGVEHLTYRGRGGDHVARQELVHLLPGCEIGWRRFRIGEREIAVTQLLRVEPAGRGSRLHLEFRSERRGLLAALLRPLATRMATSQLRFHAQAIAQAASRDT